MFLALCSALWTPGILSVVVAQAQVAQGSDGVSILGVTQKPSRHGPGPPALGVPAGTGGLDKLTSTGLFPHEPCHDFDSALISVESSLLQFLCDINSLLPVPLILLQQCFLWSEPWAVF